MNNDIIKKLPASIHAEQALLGSILIDPMSIIQVSDTIRHTDFYVEEHKAIYEAMLALSNKQHDIDVVTLLDLLEKNSTYKDRATAEQYLRTLAGAVPTALNVKDYARIVIEKSLLRQLIESCGKITERSYAEGEDVADIIEYASAQISAVAMGRDTRSFSDLNSLLNRIYTNLTLLQDNPDMFEGVKTGYGELDRTLAGIGRTDLVLIGARPGMGKTSLALNIALKVAKQPGEKVAVFSLEMSDEQLATRILSSHAMVDSYALRTGKLTPNDWEKLVNAVSDLSDCNLLIDDTSSITVSGMRAKLRREGNVSLVVVDYLQLMEGEKKRSDSRVLEISEITRGLKLLAKDLRVPVICCSQLSRGTEGRTSKRPMLSDLRESGSIEQDADTVIMIYRDDYYKEDKNGNTKADVETPVAEIIVAKNRHGSTGTIKMNWLGKYTTFYSLDSSREDEDAAKLMPPKAPQPSSPPAQPTQPPRPENNALPENPAPSAAGSTDTQK